MALLTGKKIIVTGAAQGIGRAIALEAAKNGAACILLADVCDANELADEIRSLGVDAFFIKTDLRKSSDIQALVGQSVSFAGGIDVLINNAGLTETGASGSPQSIETLTEEVWDAIMDVNLKAIWLLAKFAAPYLRCSDNDPVIVNGISVAGTVAYPGRPAYSASKGGAKLLTKAIAVELAQDGIRCVGYSPGGIRTPMFESSVASFGDPVQAERRMSGSHLIPRLGEPEEVARFVCFLASNQASFLTGSCYPVDGGTLAWRGLRG